MAESPTTLLKLMPQRASDLLADRYERMCGEIGHNGAAIDLRQIVDLGVIKVVERTHGKAPNDVQRAIVEAVRDGKAETMAQEISADVQDHVKGRGGAYLSVVESRHGALSFLPDVLIPASTETLERWKVFLDSLEPKCLRVEDPVTRLRGRIPFRDGVWFTDVILRPQAQAALPPDITEVHGNLMLRGNRPATRHTVIVRGALYLETVQLMLDAFVEELHGPLRLYSETEKTAEGLDAPPEALMAWGPEHNSQIYLNDMASYRLHIQETPEGTVHALAETPGGAAIDLKSMRWVWQGARWKRFSRELPPETAYALLRKYRRICSVLGLGEDFIEDHRDVERTVEINAERLDTLLALGMGEHSRRAAKNIATEHRSTIAAMRKRLTRLHDLAVGEGADYYRDIEVVAADIGEVLEELSDPRLNKLRKAMAGHCESIDRGKLKADAAYLRDLAGDGLDFGQVLGNAGRTLVFINNVCTSKEIRSLAAENITLIRRDLKSVLGGKPSQELLLNLLKFSDEKALAKLKRTYGERGGSVAALARHLHDLEDRTPLEMLRDFRNHPYRTVTPEVEADRTTLGRCLSLRRGTLDQMFQEAPPGDGVQDGRILQTAIMVNMQSFLAEDVRAQVLDLDKDAPSSLVNAILAKVERFRSVVPEFNRVCALHR